MKKLALLLLLLTFVLAGCSTSKAVEDKPSGAPQGIVSNSYKFERIDLEGAPAKISEIYEANKEAQKIIVTDDGEYTYMVAMMGEQRTAGYEINITSIDDNEEGKLAVTVKLTEPEKGSMVAQVISYPVDIVRIAKTNLPVYAVDTEGGKIPVEKK